MMYQTKPFVVEAMQFDGKNVNELIAFTDHKFKYHPTQGYQVFDYLRNTWVGVNKFDVIIKGSKGEFYPCNPDVFLEKYEPVE